MTEEIYETPEGDFDSTGGHFDGAVRSNLPTIRIEGGKVAEIIDAAEDALLRIGADLYQRGGAVVRAVTSTFKTADGGTDSGLRLVQVTAAHVVERMTSAARWERFRNKKWVVADCPANYAQQFLDREQWRLRSLTGVITAPTLRHDGSILDKPGYDDATGLLFEACGVKFPVVPSLPGRAEADAALDFLRGLFSTFFFEAEVDFSVALSGLFTALVRRSLPAAPLHALTAPTAGSAKTKLVDVISTIATGKKAPVAAQGRTEEETEKRLASSLIAGDSIISIDNCSLALGGDLLCQATTQQMLRLRILGQSRNIETPSNACLFATGNNLVIMGDMTRRALLCSLDPKVERPELLTFDTDVLQIARENRGAYLVAGLTIMRAHNLAAPPGGPPLGSFEHWSRRVRDALMWLGLPDPCGTIERARRDDPELKSLRAVVTQWYFAAGTESLSAQQLVEKATQVADLKDALAGVAGDRNGSINTRRLGKWLSKHKRRIVTIGDGLTQRQAKIELDGESRGSATWRIEVTA